jgi:hypothetical protein
MDGKECKTCRKWKPYAEFYLRPDNADGRGRMCKACKSAANNAHYHAKLTGEARLAEPEPQGWPVPAEADLTVQLLNLHNRRSYGAQPGGMLRGTV